MSNFAADHGRRVRSIVQSKVQRAPAPNGSRITQSWIRCLNDYRLDPDSRDDPKIVGINELQRRQDALADLRHVAEVEMANLYQQLAGSGYAIMLTDRDGVLLNFFGDPGFTHAASKTGLVQGAVWSEQVQGTNGMGTCLIERRPIVVHQEEHYLSRNIGLSCAAAPIFNHSGEVVAALDASGESHLAQQHTLALVSASVQMIENRVFLRQFRDHYILRFHNRAEFVGTLSEGAIALGPSGKVVAATRRALLLLGLQAPSDVVGRDITELFNISFCGLIDCSLKKAFHPVPIFENRQGARFFAVSYAPLPAPRARRQLAAVPAHRAGGAGLAAVTSIAARPPAEPDSALERLHCGDPRMADNVRIGRRVAERNVAVMLLGETGSGKEVFAQALHRDGGRASKPFVAINCASIPEALIESELFGYVPGAFTGARKEGHAGKLLQANGGTLFLDEIGDMPLALQTRLLRVLEEREVMPLGGEVAVRLDVRVISATHCDLQAKIAQKQFREDLYYRLHGIAIGLPPLRERSDRRQLIERLVRLESEGDGEVGIDPALLDALDRHPWPGNIRQCRHLLRSMIALRETDVLGIADLPADFHSRASAPTSAPAAAQAMAQALLHGSTMASTQASMQAATMASPMPATPVSAGAAVNACASALAQQTSEAADCVGCFNPLEHAERQALIAELNRHRWNISTLARQLKISRNTLYRKVQRLHITNPGKAVLH